MKNILTRGLPQFGKGLHIFAQRMVNAVHGYHIRLAIEELLALLCRNVAHRRESVGVLGGLLLHRLLRNNVELHGHHRRQVRFQVFVQRQPVARNGTAEISGMRGERRSYLRAMFLQIQHARACHPLVEMRHDVAGLFQIKVAETLNHLTCGIAKQHRLNIVPLAADAVQLILFPKMSKNLILRLIQSSIIHKDGNGVAFDFPAANTEFQALRQGALTPFGKEFVILNKIKRLMRFLHHIGANSNIMVAKHLTHHIRLCGKHRVDATHHVTNFPTGFKKVFGVFHLNSKFKI